MERKNIVASSKKESHTIFISEQVTAGRSDKLCGQITDAIVTNYLCLAA